MKHLAIVAAIASVIGLSGCSMASPDAGHVSVLVEKPMIFGHGGVNPEPVRTGREFIALTTDDIDVTMTPIHADVEYSNFMSSDGIPLTVDATLIVQVNDPVVLISRFGADWYDNNVKAQFGNYIRQEIRKHEMNEIAIQTAKIEDVQKQVSTNIVAYLRDKQIPVTVINVIIGKVVPPDAVKNQRIETAQQEQRQNTESQRKLAEDARKAAEQSRAAADNAYRNEMNLSPEQFVQLENIHMQHDVCQRGGCTFLVGGGAAIVSAK